MRALSSWWKKLKMQLEELEQAEKAVDLLNKHTLDDKIQAVFESLEKTPLPATQLASKNIHDLETLFNEEEASPKTLDKKAAFIQAHLGVAEAYPILRSTRWPNGIQCVHCQSPHIRRLPQRPMDSEHNHRYRCLSCHLEFNDDDGLQGEEGGTISEQSLAIWMQCWYLMRFTDSLHYIAHILGLDLQTVEWMTNRLKAILQTDPQTAKLNNHEPQEQTLSFQASIEKTAHDQTLDANVATVPFDTSEFRRQQNLRRNLEVNTEESINPANPRRKF